MGTDGLVIRRRPFMADPGLNNEILGQDISSNGSVFIFTHWANRDRGFFHRSFGWHIFERFRPKTVLAFALLKIDFPL